MSKSKLTSNSCRQMLTNVTKAELKSGHGIQHNQIRAKGDKGERMLTPQCISCNLRWANRAIFIAESLARVIVAIRIASVRWRSYLPRNTEISRHRPCVRCAAIRIAQLAFIRLTFVSRGAAEWLARVDRFAER